MPFRVFLHLAALSAGLFAGFCFCYAVVVTPALGRLDDEAYVTTMRRLNEAVPGVLFFLVIVGSVVWPLAAFLVRTPWRGADARVWLIGAAALLSLTAFVVSLAVEVPMNTQLADAVTTTAEQFHQARAAIEHSWNNWHVVRTVCAVLSTVLLVGACLTPDRAGSAQPAAPSAAPVRSK
ncbi:DUF1772 domain-containing protein [Kitasatospora griseola]|uniref:anthrone oxygenase family protein n=1 Tax=Kitasatospora griseola TaxID=2064 RepID=UPI000695A6CB|nr:DUF1772 domain-containing protein [Kitasatospora griseola]